MFELNASKFKVLRMNARRVDKVKIRGKEVEDVNEFVYLGSKVSKDGSGTEDIKNRLRKVRGAFQNLTKLWSTRGLFAVLASLYFS